MMRKPFCRPRHRPFWWPEGEPWPPPRWRARRRRPPPFMWRFAVSAACGLALMGAVAAPSAWRGPQSFMVIAAVCLFAWVMAIAGGVSALRAQQFVHDRVRRDMLADVAHELRTPLAVMQGTLEGMLDGVYPRDEARVQQLLDETKVLARLVDDLRTLTLSESGALTLQKESVDLSSLARDVAAGFASTAAANGIAIDVRADHVPSVDVDSVRVRQALANLLSNAIRATPSDGKIVVRVDADPRDVSIAVADTGRGMTPDELARIFDRFYKGADSRGSGLGLTIARNIVRLHGGEMRAASGVGTGTTITFTLPRRA